MNKEEFEKIKLNPTYLRSSSRDDIAISMGADVAQMIGFDQKNPHHCYDLWNHTIGVVEALRVDAPKILEIAGFFHDIGKPYVAQEKAGRLVFYGHALKSSEIASSLLGNMGYSDEEIGNICFYIKHHDDFISWVMIGEEYDHRNKYLIEINQENIMRHIRKVSEAEKSGNDIERWKYLLELCRADAMAQADEVWQQGKLIDTKRHKLEKISAIMKIMETIK